MGETSPEVTRWQTPNGETVVTQEGEVSTIIAPPEVTLHDKDDPDKFTDFFVAITHELENADIRKVVIDMAGTHTVDPGALGYIVSFGHRAAGNQVEHFRNEKLRLEYIDGKEVVVINANEELTKYLILDGNNTHNGDR